MTAIVDTETGELAEPVGGLVFEPVSHSYYIDGDRVPSVSEIIRPLTGVDKVDPYVLEVAGVKGTAIHRLTEQYDRGEELDVPPSLEPYLDAWIKFRTEYEFTPIEIELPLGHRQHRYAGTIDRVGILRDAMSIVDIKSGKALPSTIGVQLAGYRQLSALGEAAATVDGRYVVPAAEARFAVQLKEDGTYVVKEYAEPLDDTAFVGALGIWLWRHKLKGGQW